MLSWLRALGFIKDNSVFYLFLPSTVTILPVQSTEKHPPPSCFTAEISEVSNKNQTDEELQ